jgi:GH43 family beta-xylosidase
MTKLYLDDSSDLPDNKRKTKFQKALDRSEILDEIWAANKHMKDGHWYVKLSDVCAILGEDANVRK